VKTTDWEKAVISWCLHNPDDFGFLADRMKEFHFGDPRAKIVWKPLLQAYIKHTTFPTFSELTQILNQVQTEKEQYTRALLEQYLIEVYQTPHTGVTGDRVKEWVASKELFDLGNKFIEVSSTGVTGHEDDLYGWQERLESIQYLVGRTTKGTVFRPLDLESIENLETCIEQHYGVDPVPTGIYRLDKKLREGGIRAHLTVIFGPIGTGKTTISLGIAMNVIRTGRRVVYFSLDDNPGELTERQYSHMLKRPFCIDTEETNQTLEATKQELKHLIETTWTGDFHGVELMADTTTPHEMARDLLKMQKTFYVQDRESGEVPESEWGQIDLVVVDTADQAKPHRHYRSEWYEQTKVFEAFNVIPKRLGCPVLLNVQGNQQSVGAAQLTERNLGGTYGKNKAAKLVLGIAQTFAQVHNRITLDPGHPDIRDNLGRLRNYCPERDRDTEWERAWICVVKNTRAREGAGAVRRVKIPILMNLATCRVIDDFTLPESAIMVEQQTLREEQEVARAGASASRPSGGKRGPK